jgi:hypothetical protein
MAATRTVFFAETSEVVLTKCSLRFAVLRGANEQLDPLGNDMLIAMGEGRG